MKTPQELCFSFVYLKFKYDLQFKTINLHESLFKVSKTLNSLPSSQFSIFFFPLFPSQVFGSNLGKLEVFYQDQIYLTS